MLSTLPTVPRLPEFCTFAAIYNVKLVNITCDKQRRHLLESIRDRSGRGIDNPSRSTSGSNLAAKPDSHDDARAHCECHAYGGPRIGGRRPQRRPWALVLPLEFSSPLG